MQKRESLIVDDSRVLYQLSLALDCTTYEVLLLIFVREDREKNARLVGDRTVLQLSWAFNENYIRHGYIPEFLVALCRKMLEQVGSFSQRTTRPAIITDTSLVHIPRPLSPTAKGQRPLN